MSYSDLLLVDWNQIPLDIITSIALYLSPHEMLDFCIHNDSFNRRVCENQDAIIWKLLYQRDISENVPRDHIASRYLDIMDEIFSLTPNQRLFYGARYGYNEIVTFFHKYGADIHALNDEALLSAALNGHTETVKLLLDRGADIHAFNDNALHWAAQNGHTETVKLLLDQGARIHANHDYALHAAAYNGHPDTVKVLLDKAATITPEIRKSAEQRGNSFILALLK